MKTLPAFILALSCLLSFCLNAEQNSYISHNLNPQSLTISTHGGTVTLTPYTPSAMEVFYQPEGIRQLPSYAIAGAPENIESRFKETATTLQYGTPQLTAVIQKAPFAISYYRQGTLLLAEEQGLVIDQITGMSSQTTGISNHRERGFRFTLDKHEKLMGGGERVLGMDRRGQRLPLYNRAAYGYTTHADQMYFGIPAVMSSKKYILLFDNSAKGFMDLGKTEKNILQFAANGGRTSYLVMTGTSYPELIENYVSVTGKQPLPPRWALGNFASRFGYHSEAETRATVDRFAEEDFPLDAVILDLYWFGADVTGHMGNLEWDRKAFPQPEKMIADFQRRGVKTVLITEPFILSTSGKWQEAVDNNALALNHNGEPARFDFFFGNTGLVDVFDPQAGDWFWRQYQRLMQQGVAGWWGDLGEPEVQPADIVHAAGTGDEIHNVYGHQWAKLLYNKYREFYPETRPFLMMRSGFAGSQRYGMIPWTGDVSRSWGGLKPQVELSLQMGLLGMAYTHSDLGGFAGGETFDKEMYIRWLQYGVFQPVYRPHAQEDIAPEPVFHDTETKNILREYVKLRYRMLPYNYTLAYHNSTTGMPLMRPLFFEDESDPALIEYKDAYLWGDAFLVAPVVDADLKTVDVRLPKGVWFDFWSGQKYQGDQTVEIPVSLETIPVLVRGGAFVPMVNDIRTTRDYDSTRLNLHYFADSSVTHARGEMYDDDGKTHRANDKGHFELLNFEAQQQNNSLALHFSRTSSAYEGRPEQRSLRLSVHNWNKARNRIAINGKPLVQAESAEDFAKTTRGAYYDKAKRELLLKFSWNHQPLALNINP